MGGWVSGQCGCLRRATWHPAAPLPTGRFYTGAHRRRLQPRGASQACSLTQGFSPGVVSDKHAPRSYLPDAVASCADPLLVDSDGSLVRDDSEHVLGDLGDIHPDLTTRASRRRKGD